MLRFVFLLLISVLCTGLERSGWPGYEYLPELEGFLKVHQVPADWKQARATCHGEDALLASPWSAVFTSTISRLQSTKYPSLPTLYSGAGLGTGSSGVPMEICENKRCPVFLARGAMDKVSCNNLLPYACFAPAPTSPCEGNDYTYNSQTGKCYKFHPEGASVPVGKSICIAEGGNLAKISDPTEQTVLEGMSNGLAFIENDDGSPASRHLYNEGYSDYPCPGPHAFICVKKAKVIESDLRDRSCSKE